MTRYTVTTEQVFHLWAHQSQSHATGGNMAFNGPTLYSYHTPIAQIVPDKRGRNVALITTKKYSMTTNCHVSAARQALMCSYYYAPSERKAYYHPDVMPQYMVTDINANANHAANVSSMLKEYVEACGKAGRARGMYDWRVECLRQIIATAREYAARFGVVWRDVQHQMGKAKLAKWPNIETDIAAIRAIQQARTERANDPKVIAARKRATERKHDKIREAYRNCTGQFAPNMYTDYVQREWFSRFITDDDKTARQARLREIVERWHMGERVAIPPLPTLMRITGDEIETSRGARFPISHGRAAFPLIAHCREHNKDWQPNGHSVHLGAFKLDKINAQGDVTAGCHFVRWSEIERMARELGLIA